MSDDQIPECACEFCEACYASGLVFSLHATGYHGVCPVCDGEVIVKKCKACKATTPAAGKVVA